MMRNIVNENIGPSRETPDKVRGIWTRVGYVRTLSSSVALCVVAFALASCGGSDTVNPSPFQGSFAGNWTSTGDSGTAQVKVTPGGDVTGTELDTTTNRQGSVTGHLNDNGTFTGSVTPQGHAPVNASGKFQISKDSNTLSGSITYAGINYVYTLTRLGKPV